MSSKVTALRPSTTREIDRPASPRSARDGFSRPSRAAAMPHQLRESGVAEMVRAAATGDQRAWTELTQWFDCRIRAIARLYRLGQADVDDVSQVVWMRLFNHLGAIREPERVGAWLATTTRNECLHVLRRRNAVAMTSDVESLDGVRSIDPLADLALREQREVLLGLIGTLPARQQDLLGMLLLDPAPSYKAISEALGIPIGSIGPTRQRCLSALRAKYNEADLGSRPQPRALRKTGTRVSP